jgi:hypothetical protein
MSIPVEFLYVSCPRKRRKVVWIGYVFDVDAMFAEENITWYKIGTFNIAHVRDLHIDVINPYEDSSILKGTSPALGFWGAYHTEVSLALQELLRRNGGKQLIIKEILHEIE